MRPNDELWHHEALHKQKRRKYSGSSLRVKELPIPNKGTIIPKMGTMKTASLAYALFTKTQRRVLNLLFGNPGRSYYANKIVRFAGLARFI